MKQIAFLLSLLFLVTGCGQQLEETSAEVAEETVAFDFDAALAQAKAENKPVLLEFTGSDWCPPCKLMEKEVFSTKQFQNYQANSLVFGKLDFPRQKPQSDEVKSTNAALAEKFEISAFPTVVLLNSEGKELWRQEGFGGGGAEAFIAQIEQNKKK